jgi:hypothetical protein
MHDRSCADANVLRSGIRSLALPPQQRTGDRQDKGRRTILGIENNSEQERHHFRIHSSGLWVLPADEFNTAQFSASPVATEDLDLNAAGLTAAVAGGGGAAAERANG